MKTRYLYRVTPVVDGPVRSLMVLAVDGHTAITLAALASGKPIGTMLAVRIRPELR